MRLDNIAEKADHSKSKANSSSISTGLVFMNGQWTELKRRSLAKGPKGELLSLLTGSETEAEVRHLIINLVQDCQYSQKCPVGEARSGCAFRAMAGLSYHSMRDMAESLSFEDCLKLFEIELECRARKSSGSPRSCQG